LPVIESLAEEFAGRARFAKVQIDRDGEVQERFGASGLPSYLLFKDGREIDRMRLTFVGWFLEGRIRRMVSAALD
jgi:thioredoxin-like negative regulator of GroEL